MDKALEPIFEEEESAEQSVKTEKVESSQAAEQSPLVVIQKDL